MVVEGKSYLTAPIKWSRGEDPEYPYEAEHEGHKLLVRLNDFPEAELYALIADGQEITNFDDWPESWIRPTERIPGGEKYYSQHVVDETDDESKMLSLTPREREVLRLIAQGYSTKEIAIALNIGVRTVEAHRAHVLSILDRLRNLGRISLIPLEEQQRR